MEYWLAPQYLHWLFNGLYTTITLSFWVAFFATALGFLLCIARLSNHAWLRWPVRCYLSVFRNTPLLVQLFFWYFGAAGLLPDGWMNWLNQHHSLHLGLAQLQWPSFEFLAALWGLGLYSAAFIAEEFRSGVRAVASGQWDAAQALNFSPFQLWRYIIMPQATRNAFPALLGQYLNAIKNTSLTMAIGLAELSYATRQVETESLLAFQAFGIATLLYLLLISAVELLGLLLQHRYFPVRPGRS